ncbi:hypothetical protein M231_04069 [Tremella mesenterica]|uniref:Myosin motor domain-containing protein n=1 Tax=Tremella mesenterica TaxID=5217 RepID=A0A4Q1BLZ1_TREME|nr:hypothetical protein M231_04069 [Tremella mesenterica]
MFNGFEALNHNDLSELLINWTNEEMQSLFIDRILDAPTRPIVEESKYSSRDQHKDGSQRSQDLPTRRRAEMKRLIETMQDFERLGHSPSDIKLHMEIHRSTFLERLFLLCSFASYFAQKQKTQLLANVDHFASTVEYDMEACFHQNAHNVPDEVNSLLVTSTSRLCLEMCERGKEKSRQRPNHNKQLVELIKTLGKSSLSFVKCIRIKR